MRSHFWATPAEMLARGGDCEDFAIAKYALLRTFGLADDDLRLAVVWDSQDREEHAVLLVREAGALWVLDNKYDAPLKADDLARYRLIYSANEGEGLCAHLTDDRVRLTDDGRTLRIRVR